MNIKNSILSTFVFIDNGKIISEPLTSIREYGKWLQDYYGKDIASLELFSRHLEDGESVLEYHPGSKIGKWFDKRQFHEPQFQSWFINKDTVAAKKLVDGKFIEWKDFIPISLSDEQGRKLCRLYSLAQIELYVRSNIDRSFRFSDLNVRRAVQIKIPKQDLDNINMPRYTTGKKRLF